MLGLGLVLLVASLIAVLATRRAREEREYRAESYGHVESEQGGILSPAWRRRA